MFGQGCWQPPLGGEPMATSPEVWALGPDPRRGRGRLVAACYHRSDPAATCRYDGRRRGRWRAGSQRSLRIGAGALHRPTCCLGPLVAVTRTTRMGPVPPDLSIGECCTTGVAPTIRLACLNAMVLAPPVTPNAVPERRPCPRMASKLLMSIWSGGGEGHEYHRANLTDPSGPPAELTALVCSPCP